MSELHSMSKESKCYGEKLSCKGDSTKKWEVAQLQIGWLRETPLRIWARTWRQRSAEKTKRVSGTGSNSAEIWGWRLCGDMLKEQQEASDAGAE